MANDTLEPFPVVSSTSSTGEVPHYVALIGSGWRTHYYFDRKTLRRYVTRALYADLVGRRLQGKITDNDFRMYTLMPWYLEATHKIVQAAVRTAQQLSYAFGLGSGKGARWIEGTGVHYDPSSPSPTHTTHVTPRTMKQTPQGATYFDQAKRFQALRQLHGSARAGRRREQRRDK